MKLEGIEKLSSGLVTLRIEGLEVGIVTLGVNGFSFRVASEISSFEQIQVSFFHFQESSYQEVNIHEYEEISKEETDFYVLYTIITNQESYQKEVYALLRDYAKYVTLKATGDDAYCSYEKVGYPMELDEEFNKSFLEQKKEWFQEVMDHAKYHRRENLSYELAIAIDTPKKYVAYCQLDLDRFLEQLWSENGLQDHPLRDKAVGRVYLGNQFCHNLFPFEDTLFQMLDKAYIQGLEITIVTTYLREEFIEQTKECLLQLEEWCIGHNKPIEIVVNDFGMARLLREHRQWMTPILGVLLNKRRKDPRYSYKQGFLQYQEQLAKNHLNDEQYREYLSMTFGIKRFEYESCGYPIEIPQGAHSLHFPYYQTNTSQYCTLHATCTTGERRNQRLVRSCPYYCEELYFAYPKHLKMVGRFNSIFGFDPSVLEQEDSKKNYVKQGIDRFVLTLL